MLSFFMKFIVRLLWPAFAAAMLLGCASAKIDDARVAKLAPGKTTESDLRELFGKPTSTTTDEEGHRVLMWRVSERVMPPEQAFLYDPVAPKGDPAVRSRTVRAVLDTWGRLLKYDSTRNDGSSRVIIKND